MMLQAPFTILLLGILTNNCLGQRKYAPDHRGNFKCNNGEVFSMKKFCDGNVDCTDGSDEISNATNSTNDLVRCSNAANDVNKTCQTNRTNICEGILDCKEQQVISLCELHCDEYYICQTTGRCVSRKTLCDNDRCNNGCPEDHGWTSGIGFKCRRLGKECILPQKLLWDGIADCDGGTDLCYETSIPPMYNASDFRQLNGSRFVTSRCFQCLHDVTIIPRSRVCDGTIDCPDMSDECLCEEKSPKICTHIFTFSTNTGVKNNTLHVTASRNSIHSCKFGDLQCNDGTCVPRNSICDGRIHCSQGEDEEYSICGGTKPCSMATVMDKYCRCSVTARCGNYEAMPCNGIEECKLGADYYWDDTPGFPEDECRAKCPVGVFNCTKYLVYKAQKGKAYSSCQANEIITQDIDSIQMNRNYIIIPGTTFKIEAHNMEQVSIRKVLKIGLDHLCDGYSDCFHDTDEKFCHGRFFCSANNAAMVSIKSERVCDGVTDCDDGRDESYGICNKTRFFCPALGGKMVSIEKKLVCDASIACDDKSDEKNCSDDRFFCENESPLFVLRKQVFDGRLDCSDWSDECPTNYLSRDSTVLHSRYEMISSLFLRVMVWIMALSALLGNTAVIINVGGQMYREGLKYIPASLIANRLFILNLAVADFLMGIYLLGLAISGLTMQGEYCKKDLQWRSGLTCTVFGILTVLSSETSVATMVLLTASRLYAVQKPFLSSTRPKRSIVLLGMILSWIFSFTLALLPLSPLLQYYFTDHAILPDNPFTSMLKIDLVEARDAAKRIIAFDLNKNTSLPAVRESLASSSTASWTQLRSMLSEFTAHPQYFEYTGYLGYYSINSVCIPKFFVTASDRAWKFSFSVTLFNFVAFIFVASSYVWIYVKSARHQNIRSSVNEADGARLHKIQGKILRLIITDFCCWMPICIIAFCKISGAHVSDTAYAVAAIVLLPINSALNPILYSDAFDKMREFIFRKRQKSNPPLQKSSETTKTRHTRL